ncbi:MAG: ABC transporter permease [Candidatus Bipolaricaulia bacterium]
MLGFIIRRVLYMIPLLFVVTLIIFLLMQLMPGDAVTAYCGLGCDEDRRAELREQYGLDEPLPVQYVNWAKGIICLSEAPRCPDFGYSVQTQQGAWQALTGGGRLGWTIRLVAVSMIFSWLIAVPLGIYSATHKYSLGDHFATLFGFIGLSVPNFVLGLLFLYIVVGWLGLHNVDEFFRVTGYINADLIGQPLTWYKLANYIWHFIPPVLILAAANIAAIMRYMRGSLLDVLGSDYVQTARSKGLLERTVVWKHAVRNAINPLITMLGYWLPYMLEGALVIAIVFNLPQVEKTFISALSDRDYAVVMSGLFLFSVILMVGNLISDILLAVSDPKIRYE